MKRIALFFILFTCTSICLEAQNLKKSISLKCLQGIWKATEYTKEPFPDVSNEYIIINGNKKIILDIKSKYLNSSIIGFQNISSSLYDLNKRGIKIDSLESTGIYYTEINYDDVNLNKFNFNTFDALNCDKTTLYLYYTEYEKIQLINNNLINFLKVQGKKDGQNYLKDFLNMREIKIGKSFIYSSPNIPTKMYLFKGDKIETLEEKGEWLKIRYYGKKIVEGWIKKRDVEMN